MRRPGQLRHRESKASRPAPDIEQRPVTRDLETPKQRVSEPLRPAAEKDLVGGAIGCLISGHWHQLYRYPLHARHIRRNIGYRLVSVQSRCPMRACR